MARVCVRHPFELSDNFCGQCGLEFCRDCLVYPKGPKKPGLCVTCAISAGGVRSNAAKHPSISKRELKRRIKEREAEDRLLARHAREPAPIEPISNPFTPGWAVGTEDHPAPLDEPDPVPVAAASPSSVAPPPPPAPPPETVAPDAFVRTGAPTLADLLPSVPPTPTSTSAASATSLSITSSDDLAASASFADSATYADVPGHEDESEPEERKPRGLPLLRRREPEPVDEGASEMIAWLDEVFAPKGTD